MRRRDPALRWAATTAAAVVFALAAIAWVAAPWLRGTHYWLSHFATVDPRSLVLAVAPLGLLATLAPLLWPGTWEGVHLARSLRALTGATFLYWVLAVLLDAPRLGAYAVLPLLIAPPFATLGTLVRTPLPLRGAAVALAATVAMAVVGVALLAQVPSSVLRDTALVLLAVTYLALVPVVLRRLRGRTTVADPRDPSGTRRRGVPEGPHPFDLPDGMQSPGPGAFGLALTLAALLFVAFVVAPGVPLTTFVRWTALALTLPILLRGLVRRPGIARPEALVGPRTARVHQAQVGHLPDDRLAALDDPLDHWLRTGRGHRALARALAAMLGPVIPDATEARVSHALARMPRGRRNKARREHQLAAFLGAAGMEGAQVPLPGRPSVHAAEVSRDAAGTDGMPEVRP